MPEIPDSTVAKSHDSPIPSEALAYLRADVPMYEKAGVPSERIFKLVIKVIPMEPAVSTNSLIGSSALELLDETFPTLSEDELVVELDELEDSDELSEYPSEEVLEDSE